MYVFCGEISSINGATGALLLQKCFSFKCYKQIQNLSQRQHESEASQCNEQQCPASM